MATIFARSIILPRHTHSARLLSQRLLQLNHLPERRQTRFYASHSLLTEMMYMLYGYARLPSIAVNLSSRPAVNDRYLNNRC